MTTPRTRTAFLPAELDRCSHHIAHGERGEQERGDGVARERAGEDRAGLKIEVVQVQGGRQGGRPEPGQGETHPSPPAEQEHQAHRPDEQSLQGGEAPDDGGGGGEHQYGPGQGDPVDERHRGRQGQQDEVPGQLEAPQGGSVLHQGARQDGDRAVVQPRRPGGPAFVGPDDEGGRHHQHGPADELLSPDVEVRGVRQPYDDEVGEEDPIFIVLRPQRPPVEEIRVGVLDDRDVTPLVLIDVVDAVPGDGPEVAEHRKSETQGGQHVDQEWAHMIDQPRRSGGRRLRHRGPLPLFDLGQLPHQLPVALSWTLEV